VPGLCEASPRCVHCLAFISEVTRDHWLPSSWYPSSTEADLERWTFPACSGCNHLYGRIEDRLRSRLALALDPSAPAAQGVVASVHRAIDPDRGRNERDRDARAGRRSQLMREIFPGDQVPSYAVLPGLGPAEGEPIDTQFATLVSDSDLTALVEKLVRGLTYLQLGSLIEPTYEIVKEILAPENSWILGNPLNRFGETIDRRPGILARVARAHDDPIVAMSCFFVRDQGFRRRVRLLGINSIKVRKA